MWIGMVWTWIRSGRSSSSISFLPLRGSKLLFLFLFFSFFGLGGRVLNTGVGLVVFFFSHIQMNVVVDMHSRKEREGKEGKEGT